MEIEKNELIPLESQLDKRKNISTFLKPESKKQIKASVEKALSDKRFNFIVDKDNIKGSKDVMAELNKMRDSIDIFYKEKVEQESADINDFKEFFKSLSTMTTDKRSEIASGVKVFEDAERNKHLDAGMAYLSDRYTELEIRVEFRTFDFKLSISAFTASGDKLSTPKIKELDLIVESAEGRQAKEDLRLKNDELEIERKANEKAQKIIKEQTKETVSTVMQVSEQHNNQTEQNHVPSSSIAVPSNVPPVQQPVPETQKAEQRTVPSEPTIETTPDKKVVRIIATFDIPVPISIPNESVSIKVKKTLLEKGIDINQLISVEAL